MKKTYQKLNETKLDKNTVIIRANLNLKLVNGEIHDDSKIRALVPTLEYLQKANCKTIILSHLGDNCCEYNDELSFIPIRFAIGRYLNKPIKFVSINNCQNSIKFMEFGEVLLLENLCFSAEEFSNDKKVKEQFIKNIAQFAEYYIDESFGVDQNLASTSILPKLLKPLLGINHSGELESIDKIKKQKKEGFVSIIGGKVNDEKLKVLSKLVTKSEKTLIGGEIASLFLKNSNKTKPIVREAKENHCEIVLPSDIVVNSGKIVDASKLKGDEIICDIGPKTIKLFQDTIENAQTLILNGTMGMYEDERFFKGTNDVFETFTLTFNKELYKVVGGEDTMEAVQMLKIKHKKFNHITTGIFEFISLL